MKNITGGNKMANRDGTGPSGEGPLTGRRMGICGRKQRRAIDLNNEKAE